MQSGTQQPGDDADSNASEDDAFEALLADLLAGDLELDSEEAAAAMRAAGVDRTEIEAMLEVSEALEERGIAAEAVGVDDAPGADLVAATLARQAGLSSPTLQSERAEPRKGSLLPFYAGAIAAAAALLLILLPKLLGPGDDPGPGNYDGIDPDATLNPSDNGGKAASYVRDTGSLTIPKSYPAGALLRVTIESAGEGESWNEVIEYETESATSEVPMSMRAALLSAGEFQVRVDAEFVDGSPPERLSWPLSVE